MKITSADVAHVAALANLDIPEGETARLAEELSRIVEYVEKLNELDTGAVAPTAQVVRGKPHPQREDQVETRVGSGEAGRTVQFFKVPRVISGR